MNSSVKCILHLKTSRKKKKKVDLFLNDFDLIIRNHQAYPTGYTWISAC